MAKPLRPKRGTTAKNDAFTGLASEITIDTDKHSIRVHDGVTAGGHEILPKAKNDELYEAKGSALPLGGGDVTGNLTVQGKNAVRSVNGVEANADGDVPITIPSAYELPTATSSVLGGVKIGSNITVSSGTISLSKSNVTSALGYTPLQTAPVTSVNGMTGAVTISTGGGTSAYKIPYATCSTKVGTAAKVATISNGVSLSLVAGAVVVVKFSNNPGSGSYTLGTLNVNSTGAKTIKASDTLDTYGAGFSQTNSVYVFVYDGTYWNAVTSLSNRVS